MHLKLTHRKHRPSRGLSNSCWLAVSLILTGCATGPSSAPVQERNVVVESRTTEPATTNEDDNYVAQPLEDRSYQIEQAERYSELATRGSEEQSVNAALSAAEFYIQAEDAARAEQEVMALNPASLTTIQRNRYQIIRAYADYSRGDISSSLNRLNDVLNEPDNFALEHRQQRVDALLLASFAYQALGQTEPALSTLLEREALLSGTARAETSRYIWQVINTVPLVERQQLMNQTQDLILRNRLEQSMTGQIGEQDLAPSRFDQWREPEQQEETIESANLSTWSEFSPRAIYVLLPESSRYQRAATAVKEGILYQHELNESPFRPQLYFYDIGTDPWQTSQYYAAAQQRGADLIIGPLGKDYADSLMSSLQGQVTTPTILLGGESRLTGTATRMDLSPEHESIRVAERAAARGYINAVVLAPSNTMGERTTRAFNQAWLERGGKISKVVNYSPEQFDHSTELTLMFDLNQSQARYRALSNTLGFKPEFSPYRRNDIDFIYLIADADDARIVRPQINFFGGYELPVIASSSIYNGIESVADNMDLNDTVFPAMPWELTSAGVSPYAGQLNRLFALGSDAYQLAAELRNLSPASGYALRGNTGILTMDPDREIRIEPVWAIFREGVAETDAELTPLDPSTNPLLEDRRYRLIPGGQNPGQSQGRRTYNESNWDPRQSRRKPGS